MGIGRTLANMLSEKNMPVTELAKKVGVAPTTIYSIIERDNMKIDIAVLIKISDALGADVEQFYEEYLNDSAKKRTVFSMDEIQHIQKYRMLDARGKALVEIVLDKELEQCTALKQEEEDAPTWTVCYSENAVSAGNGYALDEYERMEKLEVVDTPDARRADFAVKIAGDSMEPTYSDEDIVLVQQVEQIEAGEIGIFFVNGSGYVKEYGSDRLISHNPKYEDIILHEYDTMRCFGKVIGVAVLP